MFKKIIKVLLCEVLKHKFDITKLNREMVKYIRCRQLII